jgi:HSP20 family protein
MKGKYFKNFIVPCLIVVFLGTVPSFAEESIEDLRKQIEALQKRVDQLENSHMQQKGDDAEEFYHNQGGRSWDPFAEMGRIQEEMDRMFQNSFGQFGQGRGTFSSNMTYDYDLDLKETEEGYEITLDMTGLDKDKIDIEINEYSITVKGEQSKEEQEESANGFFQSQSFGSFMKTIPLPVDADTTKLKTEKEGDSLVIKLPKKKS